ncbi:MAG: Fe-S cluster assembly protein SufD, partial [Natronospirillum sp.]
KHSRLNLEQEDLLHVGGVHVNLSRNARLNGFTLAIGSRLKRIDYQVSHCGEGAELILNGVYLPRGRQLVDYHTNVEHRVPHCTTSETFRGIIGDSARAVFNGRIHIHPQAQKSLAELSNKNLLTSNKAEVDTKPELEIYADDVKCAHGATVSQLDATALYYLQSRGIARAEAEVMLSFGFINELLSETPEPSVQRYLYARLGALLGLPSELLAHVASEQGNHE